jgi:SulP family sulfate permease
MDLDIRTVGDMGDLPDSLPNFFMPDVPMTWETLEIIFPYSATLMVVGSSGVADDGDDCG